jgi:Sulfotransferase domain
MSGERRPDFFIVGAPKCGTTAMAAYLRQHPQIFIPVAKELFYFGSDLETWRRRPTRAEYLAAFAKAGGVRRAGEAFPGYLYSNVAPAEILDFSPSADILIMLRDPVDMVQSYHAQQLFSGLEDIEDLERAVEVEAERAAGRHLPPGSPPAFWLQYSRIAMFADHVERYLDAFGKDRVHVVLYDDFRSDTAAAYGGVVRFLACDPSYVPDFPVVNPRKGARIATVQRLVRNPPALVRGIARRLLPLDARVRSRQALYRLNARGARQAPISAAFREELRASFAPDVRRLAGLIGRDLDHWLPEADVMER